MRVLLRSEATGLYYCREGMWVVDPADASDFLRVEEAGQACWREGMSGVMVALRTEDPECELKVPVPQDWGDLGLWNEGEERAA
jgi:hypothetical protein